MRARTTWGALLAVTSALVTSSSADAQTKAPAVSIDVVTQSMSVEIGAKATITMRVTGAPADVDIDLTSFTPVEGTPVRINDYFTTHPDRVLGTPTLGGMRTGDIALNAQ